MRTIRQLLLFALPVLLLAGCNNEEFNDEPDVPGANGDITFEIGFTPQTRVSTAADFTAAWENGDEIGVFAVRRTSGGSGSLSSTPADNYINNVRLTYSSASGGSWSLDAGVALYYPLGTDVLDFYAYYPYDASATNPTAIAFNVKADQSGATTVNSTDRSNYNLSDLLTAKSDKSGAGYSKADAATPIPLTFNHALAMVQVSVPSPGKGFGPGPDLKVTLRGVKPGAAVNLADISATAGSEITLAAADNDAVNIKMYRVEQSGDTDYETAYTYRALVPAQSVASGEKLFSFEQEGALYGDVALPAALTLASGEAEAFERSLPATAIHKVAIPAAGQTFSMGETGWATPVHDVSFTKDFHMSKYQITNAQYAAFLNATGIGSNGQGSVTYYKDNFTTTVTENQIFIYLNSWGVMHDGSAWKAQTGYENHPVINVTWYGAKAYADWSGGFLPTEAQWEYACRAGTTTAFYFGDSDTDMGAYGWSYENNTTGGYPSGTKPVGLKLPNAWGLYDMHGNVFEWCSDWYGAYGSGPDTDPVGPNTGSSRVLRGGDWIGDARGCRSAYRDFANPGFADSDVGFRVAFVP